MYDYATNPSLIVEFEMKQKLDQKNANHIIRVKITFNILYTQYTEHA